LMVWCIKITVEMVIFFDRAIATTKI